MMTLECGLRFLADHLAGDVYFHVSRPGQNLRPRAHPVPAGGGDGAKLESDAENGGTIALNVIF